MTVEEDLQAAVTWPALLFDFVLDSGERNFWTGDFDLPVFSVADNITKIYLGLANLELAAAVRESLDLTELSGEISFRGGQDEIITLALNENYQNRPAMVWFATLKMDVFSARRLLLAGRLATIDVITDFDEPLAEVTIESGPTFLRDSNDILYQTSSQRLIDSGDSAFDFVEASRTNPQPFGRT